MSMLRRVLPYLRPHRNLAAGSVIGIVLHSVVTLLGPWPLKILVDNVLGTEPLSPPLASALDGLADDRFVLLILVAIAGLLIALLNNSLTVLNNYIRTKLDQRIVLDFRGDLFQHAQRLSVAFHNQSRSGTMVYAINFQAGAASGLLMAVPPLAQSFLTLVGMLWISLAIDPFLTLLAMTVVPFLYYSVGYYARHIESKLGEVKGMEAETLNIIHDAIAMLRVIVAFGHEQHEYQRFRQQGLRALSRRVDITVRQTMFSLVINMTTAVGTALVLGFGAHQVLQGRLTLGQLLVMLSYIALVYKPLEAISYSIGYLQDHVVSLKIAYQLLDTQPEVKDVPDAIHIGRARGEVVFDQVSFSYPGRVDTLKDISFEAATGQVIAIVGPTGAGKTTLVSLLARFYGIAGGQIRLDGIDITRLSLKSLRQQLSLVLQEPLLFSGTAAENIRYGRLDAGMEDIVEAAKGANAHDFILRLPQQYETEIGERGVRLSGGERQRICVARAFLKDAPILILDEPTSSVDTKTEAFILDALDRLMVGRTTFIVAHRLSTVRHADRILVVDHGQLVEQGTHEELLECGGLYAQLHAAQNRQKAPRRAAAERASGDVGVKLPGQWKIASYETALAALRAQVGLERDAGG